MVVVFYFFYWYILLTVSILWFSKIKEILEYKKFSKVLKYDPGDISDTNDQPSEFVANLENSNQILKGMTNVTEKAKEDIDILFAQYVIQRINY